MKRTLIVIGILLGVCLIFPFVFMAILRLFPVLQRVPLKEGYLEPTGQMVYARIDPQAVLLANGKVLMCGGDFQRWRHIPYEHRKNPPCEIYDPKTGRFTLTGAMTKERNEYSMVALPNGKALIAGGRHFNTETNTLEVYNPVSGSFSKGPSIQVNRISPELTSLKNGKILITSGNTAELYDPTKEAVLPLDRMIQGRSLHTSVVLKNGDVYDPTVGAGR